MSNNPYQTPTLNPTHSDAQTHLEPEINPNQLQTEP